MIEFDLKTTTEYASNIFKKKSPKASKILDLLANKSKRSYVNLWFVYLRWVDDIIDDSKLSIKEKREFVEYQRNLITSLYQTNNIKPTVIQEACLIHFGNYAISSGNIKLLDEVKDMINALGMDVNRLERSGVFRKNELDCYIELLSKSFINVLYNFLCADNEQLRELFLKAEFTTFALMLRDLEEDLDAGIINISEEDIANYNLDIKNLKNDENISNWLADKIDSVFNLMYKEVNTFNTLPLKFKLFVSYSYIYRLPWVVRARVYNYRLNYITHHTFTKELKTYLISFLISIKILLKSFVSPSKSEAANEQEVENKLSMSEAVKAAKQYTRKRAPKLWFISHLLIPREKRKLVYLCFGYLRYVDDYVDNGEIDKYKRLAFVENQLNLITALSLNEKAELKTKEEFYLYYCIGYARSLSNDNLISEGRRNIEGMKMDAVRIFNNGIFSNDEWNKYIDKLVGPIINLSYYLFDPSIRIVPSNKYFGSFLQYVLMARDFFEDYDAGYVNISKEDIEEYNIDLKNLKNDLNRIRWMKNKYPEYLKVLEDDASVLKSLPLKLKFFWSPIYPFIIYDLVRIKIYDYNFGLKIKKSISKEIIICKETLLLSLKFCSKVFFPDFNK